MGGYVQRRLFGETDLRVLALILFAFILFLFGDAKNIYTIFFKIHSGIPWDWSDGLIADMNLNLLYKAPTSVPYVLTYYPPLSYDLEQLSGSPFVTGELLTLFSMILTATSVFLLSREIFRPPVWVSLIGFAGVMSATFITDFGTYLIPAWEGIGISLFASWVWLKGRYWSSIFLFVIAFFFRQDAILPLFALIGYLLLNKKLEHKEDALILGFWFTVISGAIVAYLEWATNGQYLEQILFVPLRTPSVTLGFYLDQLTPMFYALPLIALSLVWVFRKKSNWKSLPALLLLVSVFEIISISKFGASDHYLDFPWAAICLGFTGFLSIAVKADVKWRRLSMTIVLIGAFFSVANVGVLYTPPWNAGLVLPHGNILTDTPDVSYLAGQPVTIDASVLWVVQPNVDPLISEVNNGTFQFVVIEQSGSFFCNYPDLLSAITNHFVLDYWSNGFLIGQWRSSAESPSIGFACSGGPAFR